MTIRKQLIAKISETLKKLGLTEIDPSVEYPGESKHGDYSTNVALVAFGKGAASNKASASQWKNPMELAEEIAAEFKVQSSKFKIIEKVEVVKPGFINFWMANDVLIDRLIALDNETEASTVLSKRKIVVEFAHPNTHKAFHIGHLRNITTGEAVVRLLEAVGAKVVRVNYQGDVGMHIAKALFGLLQISNLKSQISNLKNIEEKIDFLGKAYIAGSKAYEEDENAKKEIGEINKKIYARGESIYELYQTTRQWSLDYFELIYKRVGSHFDRYYFESEVYESGKENVLKGLEKGVFEKSEGAIIFPGNKFGLHDRVFITSEGNPTYEGKEMGLGPLQFEENNPDEIIHVVGPEQAGYFQVVFEALYQLLPETRGKERHLAYGWVKLKHGKMSSRTGNVVLGEWLIDQARKKVAEIVQKSTSNYSENEKNEIAEKVAVGAVKYSFLKVSTQQEIAFDIEESVSFEGNSGPYLQYTFARTQSVIGKWQMANGKWPESHKLSAISNMLAPEERELLRLLARFEELVVEAAQRFAPNILCNYLFELAQGFNLFYQKHQILKADGESRDFRLFLTQKTGDVLKKGLYLLGIETPQKM